MPRSGLMLLALLAAALPTEVLRAQSDDSKVTLISRDRVTSAFAKGVPLVEVGDYKIHASRREGPGMAEVHTRDTDIAYVLQGSATLVTGGTAVDLKSIGPEELRGSGIRGGETRTLEPGDVVIIPNGIPHWFKEVSTPFLYYVVKVRQAKRQPTMEAVR
jgi:cupin